MIDGKMTPGQRILGWFVIVVVGAVFAAVTGLLAMLYGYVFGSSDKVALALAIITAPVLIFVCTILFEAAVTRIHIGIDERQTERAKTGAPGSVAVSERDEEIG